jgi:small-conductance mechanosensitive channel
VLSSLSLQSIDWAGISLRGVALLVTWLLVWLLVRYVGRWLTRFFDRVADQTMDRTGLQVMRSLFNAAIVAVGLLITLALLGLTSLVASMLTAAGVAGIIIGFAVKDVAANMISGMLLLADRPFSLGDNVSAGSVQGTVEKIALRSTRIRSVDGPVVTVPNSVIAANAITNFTVNPSRRFETIWTLPLDADAEAARQILLQVAAAEPRLTPDVLPLVLVGDIRNGSYDLRLICQAPNAVWGQVQSDMKQALVAYARQRDLPAGLPAQLVYTGPVIGSAASTTPARSPASQQSSNPTGENHG